MSRVRQWGFGGVGDSSLMGFLYPIPRRGKTPTPGRNLPGVVLGEEVEILLHELGEDAGAGPCVGVRLRLAAGDRLRLDAADVAAADAEVLDGAVGARVGERSERRRERVALGRRVALGDVEARRGAGGAGRLRHVE